MCGQKELGRGADFGFPFGNFKDRELLVYAPRLQWDRHRNEWSLQLHVHYRGRGEEEESVQEVESTRQEKDVTKGFSHTDSSTYVL